MLSSWDVMHLEAVGKGLFFQISKKTVWNIMERSVGEQPKKEFVVNCYSEIVATKNEVLKFFLDAIARTVFLKEPAANSKFGPICCKTDRFRFVKVADIILYLINDCLLRFFQKLL